MNIKSKKNWIKYLEGIIVDEVGSISKENEQKTLMLTGGKTIIPLYKALAKNDEFISKKNINIILSDERCVDKESRESNEKILIDFFGNQFENKLWNYINIQDNNFKLDRNTKKKLLNESIKIDFGILNLGGDGHVASIFNPVNKNVIENTLAKVKAPNYIDGCKERITVGHITLRQIKRLVILVKKDRIANFNKMVDLNFEYSVIPMDIAKKSEWIILE